MSRNARFWVWIDGWVKLTLRPGEFLSWGRSEPTEEGHRSESIEWHAYSDGSGVAREYYTYERDCDGPWERQGADYCKISRLDAVATHDGIARPDWQEERSEQRDHYAEAMGY